MQKSGSGCEKTAKTSVKEKFKYFFKETFRPHSKEEYAEVFTRGLGSNCGGEVSRKLPWLYLRVFAFNLVLFAVLVLSFRLAYNITDYLTAILLGGLLFNIPLLVFFYELYPKRDCSLLSLSVVLLVGGVLSIAITVLGYEYIYSTLDEPNVWISTLWIGFWEEFVKGVVAIAVIAVMGKKNPLYCFLIGFAVGTGYSFSEDLGYIYTLSRSYGTAWLVLTSVGRGLSCVCSHAPWTAMIAWAYAKFKKPFLNFRFYGVAATMMALHYFADVPFFDGNLDILRGVTVGWAIEAAVVAAIFVIVFFALKNEFKEIYSDGKPEYPQVAVLTERARLRQAANLTAALCAVALSVFVFAGCSMNAGKTMNYVKIYDENDFIELVQDGLPLYADCGREYDGESEDYSVFISQGEKFGATQRVEYGEFEYFYVYFFDGDGVCVLDSICVNIDGQPVYLNQLIIYEDFYYTYYGYPTKIDPVGDISDTDGDDSEEETPDDDEENIEEDTPVEAPKLVKVVSFFNVASMRVSYSVEDGCFTVSTGETEFTGLGGIIALAVLSGATVIGGSAAYITLKIKARRKENA